MELPKDLSWEITTNENGVEMIIMPRFKMNEIVEYLKYAETELKKLRVTDVSVSVCDCGKNAFKEMEEGNSIHSICGRMF
jgi:hypothetical protein